MIEFHELNVKVPGLYPELFVLWLEQVVSEEGKLLGDINVVFCDDEYLLEVNRTYLDHDYYTDIITFDYCMDNFVSGDLFISVDRVAENSLTEGVLFEEELRRVVVHGVLHLCGYGDKSDEEEVQMRAKEDFYLNRYVSRGT